MPDKKQIWLDQKHTEKKPTQRNLISHEKQFFFAFLCLHLSVFTPFFLKLFFFVFSFSLFFFFFSYSFLYVSLFLLYFWFFCPTSLKPAKLKNTIISHPAGEPAGIYIYMLWSYYLVPVWPFEGSLSGPRWGHYLVQVCFRTIKIGVSGDLFLLSYHFVFFLCPIIWQISKIAFFKKGCKNWFFQFSVF